MSDLTYTYIEDSSLYSSLNHTNYKSTWTLSVPQTSQTVSTGNITITTPSSISAKYVQSSKRYASLRIGFSSINVGDKQIYKYSSSNPRNAVYAIGEIGWGEATMSSWTSGTTKTVNRSYFTYRGTLLDSVTTTVGTCFDSTNSTKRTLDITIPSFYEFWLQSGYTINGYDESRPSDNYYDAKYNGYNHSSETIKIGEITLNAPPTYTATVSTSGNYYAGASTYSVDISSLTAQYGGTISSVVLTVGSQTASRTTNGALSINLNATGTFTPTVVATDSRGQTTTTTLSSITVKANTVPTCTTSVTSSGYYYAGASTYSVKITNATAYESKSVSSIKLTVGSQTATLTGNGTLSINLSTAGSFTPSVVITDNIGASKTYTLSAITVYANTAPTFNAGTSTSGNYYAGVTNYTVAVSNATAYNNKTISEIKLTIGSQSVTRTSNGDLTIKVSTAGTFTPVVTVKDNIGASTTWNAASLTVRANTVPSATVTVNSSAPYYEGVSARAYSVTLSDVTAYESKTITQTKLTIGSQTATGTGNGTLTITPTVIGTFTPVVTITDNIGATKSYNQTAITVNQRISQVSNISAKRIDSSTSELYDEGTNAVLTATFIYSKFTGNYLAKPTVKINGTTTNNHTWYTGWTSSGGFTGAVNWTNYQPNSPITLYAKLTTAFDINTSYTISITPVTTVLTGVEVDTNLAQAFYLLAGKAGGHALGIGKKPESDYLLDIGLETKINNKATITDKLTHKFHNQLIIGGSQTAAVTTSPYKPALWKFDKGIVPSEGDVVIIQAPGGGHSYGEFLSLDNGATYKPIAHSGTGRMTTHYASGSPIALVYDADWTVTNMYPLAGGTSTGTITGGAWRVINGYLDGNTYTSAYCTTGAATAAKTASCSAFTLKNPCYMHFVIQYANTSATALTMNVNGTGAKPIYINGSASSTSNYTLPAGSYIAYYNGTNWYFQTNGYIPAPVQTVPTFSATPTTGQVVITDGTNGRIKSSGYTIATSVPSNALFTDTNNRRSFYGTCSTAAATAAKVITLSSTTGWELIAGTVIMVKFTYTNTASNPTFNVNSSGAKNVWYNTALITTSNLNRAGYATRPQLYMYDGTQWVWIGMSAEDNTWNANAINTAGYVSAPTSSNPLATWGTDSSGNPKWIKKTLYSATASTNITSTDIDNRTAGASITLPADGRHYIIVAQWTFNTRTTSGTTNSQVTIYNVTNSAICSAQRVMAAAQNYNVLQTFYITDAITAATTYRVEGGSNRATNSATDNWIRAMALD